MRAWKRLYQNNYLLLNPCNILFKFKTFHLIVSPNSRGNYNCPNFKCPWFGKSMIFHDFNVPLETKILQNDVFVFLNLGVVFYMSTQWFKKYHIVLLLIILSFKMRKTNFVLPLDSWKIIDFPNQDNLKFRKSWFPLEL